MASFLPTFISTILLISAVRGYEELLTRENHLAKRKAVQIQCSEENNVTPDYFYHYMAGDAVKSENGKCFVKCTLDRMGYLNEAGSLVEEKIRETARTYYDNPHQQELAINAWLECGKGSHSESSKDGPCDKAFDLAECYILHIAKAGVDINFHHYPEEET